MTPQTQQLIDAHPELSAAEVVALVAAQPPVTVAPIDLPNLASKLQSVRGDADLYLRLTDLADAKAQLAPQVPADAGAELVAGLRSFVARIRDKIGPTIDTTDATIAAKVARVLAGLVDAGELLPAEVDAIYALGGGLAYAAVTEQAVSDYRAAKSRADAWAALNNARFTADQQRSEKLNWLEAHADVPVPADLAGLDAFEVP
jgi:hypothetical protein